MEALFMNTYEQRVREQAYQIWESEGRPTGHESRHWEMACKLINAQYTQENISSMIIPEEPFNPDSAPEIDPASPQPTQSTPPPAHPSIPPRIKKPVDVISFAEYERVT